MAADLIVQIKAVLDQYKGEMDEAAAQAEEFGERGSGAMSLLTENIGAITAATAGAGAALEGFARTQASTNESLERASIITGQSTESLRDMIDGMTDHTNSSADMVEGMDELIRRGLRTREEFEAVLPVMDEFAGATGQSMPEAIDNMNRVLQALGEPLENAGDHVDQMTRFVRETDVPMGTLRRNLSRIPDELQNMNFGLEDVAAGIEVMRERGFSGEEAVREFRRTVEEGEGDLNKFFEALGVTSEEFAGYQEKVGQADGITQQFAETNAAQLTPLQEAQQWVANLLTEYGGLAQTAAQLAPALIAVGPAIKGVQLAMSLALGPIGVIAAAIAGLATAAYLVYTNWEEVKALLSGVWETIKSRATAVFDTIKRAAADFVNSITGFFGDLKDDVVKAVDDMVDAVVEKFTGMFTGAVDSVKDMASGATGWIKDMANEWVGNSIIPDMVDDVLMNFDLMHTGTVDTTAAMTTDLTAEVRNLATNLGDIGEQLGIDWLGKIGGMVDGTIGEIQRMWNTVSDIAGSLNSLFGGGSGGGFFSGLSGLFSGGGSGGGGLAQSLGGVVSAGKSLLGGLGGLFGGGAGGGISGSSVVGTSPLAAGGATAGGGLGLAATQAGVVAAPLILGPMIDKMLGEGFKQFQARAQQDLQGAGPAVGAGLGLRASAGREFGFAGGANVGFADQFAQDRGIATAGLEGGVTAFEGLNLPGMIELLDEVEGKFEQLKSRGASMFADLGVSAVEMGDMMRDGFIDEADKAALSIEHIGSVIENPKTGMKELGALTVVQFDQIVAAIDRGELRLEALQGATTLTAEEMQVLGEIGVGAHSDIVAGAHQAAGAARSLGATSGQVMDQINASAAGAARSFGTAFSSASDEAIGGMQRLRDESTSALSDVSRAAVAAGREISGLSGAASAAASSARRSLGSVQAPQLNVPGLADGAIVTGPTLAMIGEGRDHEAVFPLRDLDAFLESRGGGGRGMQVTINQTITGVTPDEVERQTDRAFRRVATEWAMAS